YGLITRIIENYFDDIFLFFYRVSPCEIIFGFRGIGFCDKRERAAASLYFRPTEAAGKHRGAAALAAFEFEPVYPKAARCFFNYDIHYCSSESELFSNTVGLILPDAGPPHSG